MMVTKNKAKTKGDSHGRCSKSDTSWNFMEVMAPANYK